MSDDLVNRLLEPDWHDPKCPHKKHCYCGNDENPSPHDRVRHPDAIEAAARIRELEAEVENAKAVAHGRGYQQGKAAGDAFGAAMREHVTRLEAEVAALRAGAGKLEQGQADAVAPEQPPHPVSEGRAIGRGDETLEAHRHRARQQGRIPRAKDP